MTSAPRVPGTEDLRSVLIKVIEDFAYLLAVPGPVAQAELPLAVRAALPDGRGWLLLRSTPTLARQLAEASSGESSDGLDLDSFVELCNLAASHLVSQVWAGERSSYQPFVPEMGAPLGRQSARVMLDVDGQLLEASYWATA